MLRAGLVARSSPSHNEAPGFCLSSSENRSESKSGGSPTEKADNPLYANACGY